MKSFMNSYNKFRNEFMIRKNIVKSYAVDCNIAQLTEWQTAVGGDALGCMAKQLPGSDLVLGLMGCLSR